MALSSLLRAGVAPVGVVGVPFASELGGLLEELGFGGFNAYKKPLLRPEGALEPLLWPCGGFCVREWRVLSLLGYLFPAELCELLEGLEGFGGFEAWQTAALNAYKKPLQRPEGALSLRSYANVWRVWRVLEGLRPGKRQPWTPIRSHCSGRKVPLSHCCGLVVACACGSGACWACWGTLSLRSYANFWSVWRVLGFEAWQTAALNAYKKPLLRPEGALEPLLWPCGGFCVREWRVLGLLGYLFPAELCERLEGLEGFGGFEAWQTAALNAYKKPLQRPEGALSLRSYANVWRVWRVLEGLRPGKRQPWTPIRSHCSGRKVPLSHCCGLVVACACGSGACWACWGTFSLRSYANFWRVWRVLEGLKPGKRQPWTPI